MFSHQGWRGLAAPVLVIVLAACSAATPSATTPPAATASPGQATTPAPSAITGTVEWWTAMSGDYVDIINKQFVDPLKAAYPGIDLKLVSKGDANADALRTAIQAGAGPDIVELPSPNFIGPYVEAGYLEPLDNYAAQYGWSDTILGWALDSGRRDNALYALPATYETLVVYYNKKLFQSLGIAIPTNRAELEAAATTLMQNGIYPFANAHEYNSFFLAPLFHSVTGPDVLASALNGETPWTDPRILATPALMNQWVQAGWFRGSPDAYLGGDEFSSYGLLSTGKAAMLVTGTWGFAQMNDSFASNPDDWDFFQFPAITPGIDATFPLWLGGTYSINADSDNKDAAAAVLNFIYSDPKRAATTQNAMGGEWHVPITLQSSDFPTDMEPRFARALDQISAATRDNVFVNWGNQGEDSINVWQNDLDRVFLGEITVDDIGPLAQAAFEADNQP